MSEGGAALAGGDITGSIQTAAAVTTIEKIPRNSKMFRDQEILPGLTIDVATYPQDSTHYMAYLPQTDNIYIFGMTYDELENGHDVVVDIGALHESDHALYFRLSANQQIALNDTIMRIVSSNPQAGEVFKQFVKALYTRPGADYLHAHKFDNKEVEKILADDDKKAGLKDKRWLQIDVNGGGQTENLYLALVLTEFFAYMSAGHHQRLLDPQALKSINAQELTEVTTRFRQQFIDNDPKTSDILKQNGGFGLRREIPNFRRFITGE